MRLLRLLGNPEKLPENPKSSTKMYITKLRINSSLEFPHQSDMMFLCTNTSMFPLKNLVNLMIVMNPVTEQAILKPSSTKLILVFIGEVN